jgi:hypothetical protein
MTESRVKQAFQHKFRHSLVFIPDRREISPKEFKAVCYYWFLAGTRYQMGVMIKNKDWRKGDVER